jgi:hypothetical protein
MQNNENKIQSEKDTYACSATCLVFADFCLAIRSTNGSVI